MIDKQYLAKMLRLFAATVEGLDQDQVDQLIAGKARLTFSVSARSKETNSGQPVDETHIVSKLNDCRDRDEARNVLSEIKGRDALAALARTMKVHVVKHDRREDIESKIIEFVIGGRLRTEAIQSLNLKGGGSVPTS